MPSFSVGFAQVEERLRAVRRRLNLLTLQNALYLSGSLVALAATLLIVLALRGHGSLFAIAAWAAAGAIAAAIAAAVLQIRQRWLSVDQVVTFADRQAELDNRLASLLLDPARARSSPLKEILLAQILDAAPRWDIDSLVPRRVPRTLFVFAGSLASLIALSFFSRPPAAAKPPAVAMRPHADSEGPQDPHLPVDAGSERADDARHTGAGAAPQLAGLETTRDGSMRSAGATSVAGSTGTEHSGTTAAQGTGQGMEGQEGQQASPGASAPTRATEGLPPGVAEKLRAAIRDALGAETPERRELAKNGGAQSDEDHAADKRSMPGARPGANGTASMNNDARSANSRPPSASAHLPGAGSAATAGARGGEAPTQLFGNAVGARMVGNESQDLPLKLGAFASVAPSQVEPQRDTPPINEPVTVGSAGANGAPALVDEQAPDAPLQKAEVSPEHEALVRRIFTRDE